MVMSSLESRTYYAILLIVPILIASGCATTEQFTKKYPGYTVIAKERKESTQDVPVWIMSCVTPNGAVRCQVRATGSYPNPGVNSCTVSCDHKHGDRWNKQQIGTTKEAYFVYIVRLQSPVGEEVEDKVTSRIFNEIREGQVFPMAASK